jgi:hypothetical protein
MKAWEAIDILMALDRDTEVILTIGRSLKPKNPLSGVPQWDHRYLPPTFVPNWMDNPKYSITCKTVH